MADPKGAKLFVNLSAAQTRRRLKGFGHGVRKIHSAGKNQAVVIHTAVGRHLDELRAKFADVGCSTSESELGEPIGNLRNLGETSAGWLREIGITTIDDLRRVGPVFAFRRVRQLQGQVSFNLLWAMFAGLADRDWRSLTQDEKERLRAEVTD